MAIVENGCSGSTTYEWRKVKITAPPRPTGHSASKASTSSASRAGRRREQEPLRAPKNVQVRFRGGADTWWELTWGGVTKRFPGYVQLDDALLCLFTHGARCKGHRDEMT